MLENIATIDQNNTDLPPTVLVVEDDSILNKLICNQLTKNGLVTTSASNGIECINNLRIKKFSVLLIDYKLPDLNIEEIFKKLLELHCTISFIVMTGYGDEQIAVAMMKLGAKDYIVKDTHFITRLPEVIKRVLQEIESEQRLICLQNDLIENEERLRLFTENTKDIIVLIDRNGIVKWLNAAWERTFGKKYTSLADMKNLIYPEDIQLLRQSWRNLLFNNSSINNLNYRIQDSQGKTKVYESTVFPLDIKGENLFYIISRDITENVETEKKKRWVEEQLHYAKKMEFIGKLTSGIAEDFNNILTGIGGYANMLIDTSKDESQLKYARKIYELAMNGGVINAKLLAYAHQKNLNIELVGIHSVIHSVVENFSKTITKVISLETTLEAQNDNVVADRTLMEMVIMNIIVNAYEAIPETGKISIKTTLDCISTDSNSYSSENKNNSSLLQLSIKDTGIGISKVNQENIFEPFFSTKKNGYANGLGLSTTHGYVKRLNGSVSLQSELGKGTEVMIHLPLAEETYSVHQSYTYTNENKKQCSVLVVDDEKIVRETVTLMLKRMGCSVMCCEDGEKGYSYFIDNHSNIDFIILDILMPNIAGNECFYKLREVKSDIPIIISSAFAEESIVRELSVYNSVYFLKKPYTLKGLSNVIAEVIEGK